MKRSIFLIFVFSFLLVSCSKDNSPTDPGTNPPPPPTPIVGNLTLKENTHQITKKDMGSISFLGTSSMSLDYSISKNLHVGDIIFSDGYNSKAPKGFLRKITSISGGTIQTEPAALRDAFKEGTLDFSFSPSLFKKPHVKGVIEKESGLTSKTYGLNYVIYDYDGNSSTKDDQLRLEGSLKIDGGITGKIDFLPFSIKSTFNFKDELDLNLVATGALNYSTEKRIFSVDAAPIVVSGVVITPELTVSFKPEVSVSAKASIGINDKIGLTSSLKYDGSWKKSNNFQNFFKAKPVQFSLNGKLKGTLYFELTLYLEELIGPGVNIGPFARLEANINSSPWWILYAGAQGNLFLRTKGIASGIPDFKFNLFNSEKEISHATQSGPGKPSNPSPYDGEGNVSSPVTLSWACNPPGDYYKLIYTIGSEPTVIKNHLTNTSYSLENAEGGKHVLWMVRSFNSMGDSTQGDVWSFDFAVGNGNNKSLTLQPGPEGEDVTISHSNSNGRVFSSSYPDDSLLTIINGSFPGTLRKDESFIKFNLSSLPLNSKVSSAKLMFYGGVGDSPSTVSLAKLNGFWSEQSLTWETKPPYTIIDSKEFEHHDYSVWYEFDVTQTVQDWVNGQTNYGFELLMLQEGNTVLLASGDYSWDISKRPKLEIIYK